MSRSQRSCGNSSPHQSSRTALPYRTICRDWQRHFGRCIDYPPYRFRYIAGIRHHLRRQLHPRERRTRRVGRWYLDFQFGRGGHLERQQDQLTGSGTPRRVSGSGRSERTLALAQQIAIETLAACAHSLLHIADLARRVWLGQGWVRPRLF